MDMMPVSMIFFGSIPEAFFMLWAGLLLMGKKVPIKKMLLVAILQGISCYFIRNHIIFGWHVVIQMVVFTLYTYLIIRVNLFTALLSIVVSTVIVVLIEGTIMVFAGRDIAYIFSVDRMRIIFSLPHKGVLIWIIYMCRKKDISLLKEFGFLNRMVK